MKTFWLVMAGMADDPLEALGGRTPLETAKTPFMDAMAKDAVLGNAAWLSPSLPASDEVAAYSMLGYDPKESYTGLAPLEALAAGLPQSDAQIVFRCDFVTVSDGELSDHTAGKISDKEAQLLIMELNRGLGKYRSRIVPVEGYRNLLVIDDPEKAADIDQTETVSPSLVNAQQISKWPLKGKAAALFEDITHYTRGVLENHDVNRVRIDLGENPASQVWLWGQGRRPRLKPLAETQGVRGAYLCERAAWRGLGMAAGMKPIKKWEEHEFADFNLIEYAHGASDTSRDFKGKVRRIEEFDAKVVGRLVMYLESKKTPARVVVTSDLVQSTAKGANTHSHAPVMLWGSGAQGAGAAGFNEKNCGLSGRLYDPGHTFIGQVLKG